MQPLLPHYILGEQFIVSAQRTLFWEAQQTLILSDLHLGKTGHFRKSGIAIPQNIFKEDLHKLLQEVQFFKPKKIIIVGDLFHSSFNKEFELFKRWRNDIDYVAIDLIKGNHDILPAQVYTHANIQVIPSHHIINGFCFTHDMADVKQVKAEYFFSGHIHPGINIKGLGKQSLQLACFYFTEKYAVLPAFGRFTGTHTIKPQKGDHVYGLVENKVTKIY
ncbi:ligase-associated DNA damage response endonuclease PdeM [Ferruginibacter yonginensis]|uniref:Ligase-associated DNA damage response endonuclease PdeM n=1 Tax=Ferruginibacter yonginensis TaxID=1310416 RepID=A0ABV8QP64_9BACT